MESLESERHERAPDSGIRMIDIDQLEARANQLDEERTVKEGRGDVIRVFGLPVSEDPFDTAFEAA